jgi:hypothetical protein
VASLDVAGRHVVVVDYCFSPSVTRELVATAASVTVLDHHASALKAADAELADAPHVRSRLFFELRQSGATLAWDYIHATPGKSWPRDAV